MKKDDLADCSPRSSEQSVFVHINYSQFQFEIKLPSLYREYRLRYDPATLQAPKKGEDTFIFPTLNGIDKLNVLRVQLVKFNNLFATISIR